MKNYLSTPYKSIISFLFIFCCWVFLHPSLLHGIPADNFLSTITAKNFNTPKEVLKNNNTPVYAPGIEVYLGVDDSLHFENDIRSEATTYRVDVNITWNSDSPAWPDTAAHFSWFGGANHNDNTKFWEVGTLASKGMDRLAVTGNTEDLLPEIYGQIVRNNAENLINVQHWFCPEEVIHSSCGELSFEIEVCTEFPLVTLVSMLGPSPDWFVGTESLSMVDEDGVFIPEITYELYPYDAGILSDNSVLIADCCAREPLSVPQENIHLITTESGEAIGPGSLGQIVFTEIEQVTTRTRGLISSSIVTYPNPTSRNLYIETELLDFAVSIFDLRGALLYTDSNRSLIDVTQFANGIYLLEITDTNTKDKLTKRIVVEK